MALNGNEKAQHTDGDSWQGIRPRVCRTGAERLGGDRCSYFLHMQRGVKGFRLTSSAPGDPPPAHE